MGLAKATVIGVSLAIGALELLLTSSARALGLTPMRLEHRRGLLQVSNVSNRMMRVELQVFTERHVQGRRTAALTPLPTSEAEALIHLRPSVFRLAPGGSRLIPYSVTKDQQPFYLCGTSLQNLLQVRICSHWQPVSSATRQR